MKFELDSTSPLKVMKFPSHCLRKQYWGVSCVLNDKETLSWLTFDMIFLILKLLMPNTFKKLALQTATSDTAYFVEKVEQRIHDLKNTFCEPLFKLKNWMRSC